MCHCVSQVSKTAPTGEYLTTGSFMIRGNDLSGDYGDRFEDRLLTFSEANYSDFIYEVCY